VDIGDNRDAAGVVGPRSCILRFVSWPDVEGVGGEIRRYRETVGRLTGQGKPEVVPCQGRLKATGRVDAKCHGLATSSQYREAKSTGSFAPPIPSLPAQARPRQEPRRSNATLNKDRGRVTVPLRETEAFRLAKRPKGLAAPSQSSRTGVRTDIATGRRGRKAPPFLVWVPPPRLFSRPHRLDKIAPPWDGPVRV
jgi:hypothetical protein